MVRLVREREREREKEREMPWFHRCDGEFTVDRRGGQSDVVFIGVWRPVLSRTLYETMDSWSVMIGRITRYHEWEVHGPV